MTMRPMGDTHYDVFPEGGWVVKSKLSCIGHRGWGVASVLDVQSLGFFVKENWVCAMTGHYPE